MRESIDQGANDNTEIKRLNDNKAKPETEPGLPANSPEVEPASEVEPGPGGGPDSASSELVEEINEPAAHDTLGETAEGEVKVEPALEDQVRDLKDQLLRALAESENTRRRAQREKEDTAKYAITNFARDVLSVSDNLARALDAVPQETRASSDAMEALYQGVELTQRELQTAMERHGIKQIEPLDEKFDHNLHQAMFEIESADSEPGTVVQVVQAGYVIGERLLRPAMVAVAKKPASLETPKEESGERPDDGTRLDTKA
jgi:molecular chaperone GrpE